MPRKRNQILNIVEAVASFLVVFIHYPLPGQVGETVAALARISVPLFYCISGYFFYKGDVNTEVLSIAKKIKRLVSLIIFSEAMYFLFYVTLQVDNIGFTFLAIVNVIDAEIIDNYIHNWYIFLSVFAPPFNGTGWFIGSLIVVYLISYVVVQKRWQKGALIGGIILLLSGILLRRILYCFDFETSFPYERLIPFLPFPFFILGYYIHKNQAVLNRISNGKYLITFFCGFALTVAESFLGMHTLYYGTVLLVLALIAYCGKQATYTAKTPIWKYLSHVGDLTATYIYLFHMLISFAVIGLLGRISPGYANHPLYLWGMPFLVCILSELCGEIIIVAKHHFLRR